MNMKFFSSDIYEKSPVNIDFLSNDERQKEYKSLLSKSLNRILDAENIIVLAGSGVSLTFNTSEERPAPSMSDLWDYCEKINSKSFNEIRKHIDYDKFANKWINKKTGKEEISKDIELLLSRCDTLLTLQSLPNEHLKQLKDFVSDAKLEILKQTNFTDNIAPTAWEHHNKLLRVLAKRQPKQKRLKLFTTNYDLAFEVAASNTGMIVIDGFEYGRPHRFNPAWFHYDIIHKTQISDKANSYLPNVFHLYKIHGSVDWIRTEQGIIQKRISDSQKGEPVIIYPSSTKYQTSYESPYLDMMASFLEAVQKPKTAILCLGFGFNDKHINNAITMALRTNPELLLMIGTRSLFDENSSFNKDIRELLVNAVKAGDSRITLIDSDFATFVEQLPERNKPTPEEQIFQFFQQLNTGENK